jgi:hypothetical protein
LIATVVLPLAAATLPSTAPLAATSLHRTADSSVNHRIFDRRSSIAASRRRRNHDKVAASSVVTFDTKPTKAERPLSTTPAAVIRAVQIAQQRLGADPDLLLAIASQESGFNPKARNRHSSARGLLQFTNVTWLTVIRDFGSQHGLRRYAAAIDTDRSGRMSVKTPRLRRAILDLRKDPLLQVIMATERLNQERAPLELRLGHPAQLTDLYFLHLLGPAGAAHFLTELAEHPDASSSATVGAQTKFNEGLFVRDGRPLTVAEAYASVQAALAAQASGDPDHGPTKVVSVADIR